MARSKLTKLKEITQKTREEVWNRQHGRSISGVALNPYNVEFHHVISRGNEGIGLAYNIVAITSEEHRWYHDHRNIKVNGRDRYTFEEFTALMKNHLKIYYPKWTENGCKYHKGWTEEDYWKGIENADNK